MRSPISIIKSRLARKLRATVDASTSDLRTAITQLSEDLLRHSLLYSQQISALEKRIEDLEKSQEPS